MGPPCRRPSPPRALSPEENERIVQVLHEDRFVDKAPPQVYAALLGEGVRLCCPRTMYRILRARKEVQERRRQARRRNHKKPQLRATKPNQVWSWDITKLKGAQTGELFCLYTIVDIFSRFVVGWMIAPSENAELAIRLFKETCERRQVDTTKLKIHSDRGAPMTAKKFSRFLKDLGAKQSFSRPKVSNDNAISESLFKTLKYNPQFPDRFGSFEDAEAYCQRFFHYYNFEHFHSSLALMTPHMVHSGDAKAVSRQRQAVLTAHYKAHPERFVNGPPKTLRLPKAVWINPPESTKKPTVVTITVAESSGQDLARTATTAGGKFIGTV